MTSPIRLIARPLLSSMFVASGVNTLRSSDYQVQAARDAGMPNPERLVQLHAVGNLLGGFGLATGRLPRLAALGLAVNLVPTTYVGHPFWNYEGQERQMQQINFLKNLSMLGGTLLAVADTGGRESVTHAAGRIAGGVSSAASDRADQASRKVRRQNKKTDKLADKARTQSDKVSKQAAKQAKVARKEGGKKAAQLGKQAQKKASDLQQDLSKRAAAVG